MATDYRVPIEKFLTTKVQEYFPDFDLREGTAFRDMLIKPMIIFVQPYRDQVNIIKRNLSLQNFELMVDDEMDALAANVFVTRRGGVKAEGTVRVYVLSAQQTSFSTNVQFKTAAGLIFYPKATTSFTAEEMALNVEGLYFYADVPCVAELEGVSYNVPAHSIAFISGGPDGVAKVDNLASFDQGVEIEDNATLYDRAKTSISVRDLVTKRSISSVLLENFNTLRELAVIGFGDPEMDRDVITTVIDMLQTLEERTTGEITGFGTIFQDFDTVDPVDFVALGIQPGHRLVILSGADEGNHTIKAVTGTQELELYDALTVRSGIQYGIDGMVIKDDFHIGGKVDVYVDTTTLADKSLYLEPAAEVNELVPPAAELPVVGINLIQEVDPSTYEPLLPLEDYTLWAEGTRFSEDRDTGEVTAPGNVFEDVHADFLALGIKAGFNLVIIDGLDAGSYPVQTVMGATTLQLYSTLSLREDINYRIEASDYRLETTDPNTRLSVYENVRIRLLQNNVSRPRYFIGSTLGVTYYADAGIAEYQTFVINDQNRVVTTDILIRRCLPAFIDIDVVYSGDALEADVVNVIREFIDDLKIGATFQASDLVATLYFFNITYVNNGFLIKCDQYDVDGVSHYQESAVSISIPRTSKYVPRTITATKVV